MPTSTQPLSDRIASRYPFHLVALGVLFYGTGPVLARSSSTTGVLLSFWRLWFGVGILAVSLGLHLVSGRELGTRRGLRLACAAGAAFSLNQVLFFSAIKRTSVVDTTLMTTLAPILVGFAAVPLFGERPGPTFRAWSAVAMFGATFVVLGSSAGPSGDLLGMLMAIGSTTFFVAFFILSKLSRAEMPVVTFLTVVMTTAAVCVSGFVIVAGLDPGRVSSDDLWRAAAMALVPGTLGHIVMTWPLKYIPANIPPLMRLAGPVVSGTMAWIFLGEGVTWVHLIGGVIITVGAAGAIRCKAGQDLVSEMQTSESAS